jgi:hypothetical protein
VKAVRKKKCKIVVERKLKEDILFGDLGADGNIK